MTKAESSAFPVWGAQAARLLVVAARDNNLCESMLWATVKI
jgi:hypothetical protein